MLNMLLQVPLGRIDGLGNFLPDTNDSGGPYQIERIVTMIFGFLTIVGGLTFLIYFLVGALNWITGGDDKGKVDTAKKYMTNGVIGMITIVAAYAVIWIVGSVLGLDILNPGLQILRIYTGQSGADNLDPRTYPLEGGR